MNKYTYLLLCFLLSGFSFVATAQLPTFIGGHTQRLSVCKNSDTTSISALLQVSDTSIGHTVTWAVFTAPAHGTLVAVDTAISTGGTLTPAGLTYKPSPGYSGSDGFTVRFADGISSDTTHVSVTVDTVLNAGVITGPPSLCAGAHIIYTDTIAGGVWTASNTRASVGLTGTVTGVSTGIDTIRYSLTNACGISSAAIVVTVNGIPNAGHLATPDSICVGSHLALEPRGDRGGVWHSSNATAVGVNDTGRVTGIAPGASRVTYIVTNGCGADTTAEEIKVQTRVLPILLFGTDTVCQFQMLTLLDPSVGGGWTSSSFFVAAVIGGIVVGVTPGDATITYTLHNACGATTTTQDVVVEPAAYCASAVNTVTSEKEELSIFPNPNNGIFTLNLSSTANEPATVVVTNIVGEKVTEFNTITNHVQDVTLDKPAGIYFVKVATANAIHTAKVIISR